MSSFSSQLGQHLLQEAPSPILFNPWKHHVGSLRHFIPNYCQRGANGVVELAQQILVLGTEVMDLYTGAMTVREIAQAAIEQLVGMNKLELEQYRAWLTERGGYGLLDFPDGSRWVCRMGTEDGRHVHLHPGRWSAHTRRVRANVLKTAILSNAQAMLEGDNPLSITLINKVREKYLGLSPIPRLDPEQGLQPMIELLKVSRDPNLGER